MTDETRETHAKALDDLIQDAATNSYPEMTDARVCACLAGAAALRDVLTPRTCGNCKHLDPENRGTEWGFCGAENEDYGAYPFQGRSMPLDERCKGWQAREGEGERP